MCSAPASLDVKVWVPQVKKKNILAAYVRVSRLAFRGKEVLLVLRAWSSRGGVMRRDARATGDVREARSI
jgi:hypothetical protein